MEPQAILMRVGVILLCLVVAAAAGAAPLPDDRVIHAGRVDDLFAAAKDAGLRIEERGNGCYFLKGKGYDFDVGLPDGPCEPIKGMRKIDQTILFMYTSERQGVTLAAVNAWNRDTVPPHVGVASLAEDGVACLDSTLIVEYGVTPRTVEEHLRHFAADIRQFEAGLRKAGRRGAAKR